jgi:hypothetical protein
VVPAAGGAPDGGHDGQLWAAGGAHAMEVVPSLPRAFLCPGRRSPARGELCRSSGLRPWWAAPEDRREAKAVAGGALGGDVAIEILVCCNGYLMVLQKRFLDVWGMLHEIYVRCCGGNFSLEYDVYIKLFFYIFSMLQSYIFYISAALF